MTVLLLLLLGGLLWSKPIMESFAEVKRFPFVAYREAWTGTPASSRDVAVPNVVIAYGPRESRQVLAEAAQIAYYLGQWTEDPGITPRMVRKGNLPSILLPLPRAMKTGKNILLLGTENEVVRKLGIRFRGPTLKVIEYEGRRVLIVGGRNPKEVRIAARFLANRVIGFKAGACRTFFSFVRLRGMIEKGEFTSALNLVRDPAGLSACGKNMSLAAPMMLKFPPEVKKIVKKRNRILYRELPQALRERNREKAIKLWKSAMVTCYRCHQGLGVERIRKFIPNPDIHARHQRIAAGFGLVRNGDCSACHSGPTEIRGY